MYTNIRPQELAAYWNDYATFWDDVIREYPEIAATVEAVAREPLLTKYIGIDAGESVRYRAVKQRLQRSLTLVTGLIMKEDLYRLYRVQPFFFMEGLLRIDTIAGSYLTRPETLIATIYINLIATTFENAYPQGSTELKGSYARSIQATDHIRKMVINSLETDLRTVHILH